jgi:hypothetical protein
MSIVVLRSCSQLRAQTSHGPTRIAPLSIACCRRRSQHATFGPLPCLHRPASTTSHQRVRRDWDELTEGAELIEQANETSRPLSPPMNKDEPTTPVPTSSESDNRSRRPARERITDFTSPPLLPGLLDSLRKFIGPYARPMPVQVMSLENVLTPSEFNGKISKRCYLYPLSLKDPFYCLL